MIRAGRGPGSLPQVEKEGPGGGAGINIVLTTSRAELGWLVVLHTHHSAFGEPGRRPVRQTMK